MEILQWGYIDCRVGDSVQAGTMWRAKVPGGWLYRYYDSGGTAMAFVPEPAQANEAS